MKTLGPYELRNSLAITRPAGVTHENVYWAPLNHRPDPTQNGEENGRDEN